jgi:hypothetical protein
MARLPLSFAQRLISLSSVFERRLCVEQQLFGDGQPLITAVKLKTPRSLHGSIVNQDFPGGADFGR